MVGFMYKVLIADDEPRHRKGLANMIRNFKPDYEVFEARDGEEALEVINAYPVDIIFTDIRMPNIDGLEFIEKLGDRIKSIKIIIISVYGYFEYAQKAINLGAFAYMLKPFEESSIEEMLKKVENKLVQERLAEKEKESMARQLSYTLPVYVERQLNRWVRGLLNADEIEEVNKIFPYRGPGTVILSEIGRGPDTPGYSGNELMEIHQTVKYWMRTALKSLGHSISFFLTDRDTVMATIFIRNSKISLPSEESLEALRNFIGNLKAEYGFETTVGLGTEYKDISHHVTNAFEQARAALSTKFYLGKGKVIPCVQTAGIPYKASFGRHKAEAGLTESILHMDREKALKTAEEILEGFVGAGCPPPHQLTEGVELILLNQVKSTQELLSIGQYEEMTMEIKRSMAACEDYRQLKHRVSEIILKIIACIEEKKSNKNQMIISKCKKYIEEHYPEELSMESIAQKFFFNPSYFSNLFKNYAGIGFSEYLLKVRLKKAKELLRDTDWKVYEIAIKVGYRDPGYFNRLFSREFGIAPDEYRRMVE